MNGSKLSLAAFVTIILALIAGVAKVESDLGSLRAADAGLQPQITDLEKEVDFLRDWQKSETKDDRGHQSQLDQQQNEIRVIIKRLDALEKRAP